MRSPWQRSAVLLPALLLSTAVSAQDDTQELAKKLSNPIASLISVPFQFNYDTGYGPNDGEKAFVNIQPVIPFTLNEDWNLISRTIVPIAPLNTESTYNWQADQWSVPINFQVSKGGSDGRLGSDRLGGPMRIP